MGAEWREMQAGVLIDGMGVFVINICRVAPGVGVNARACRVSPGEVFFDRVGQSEMAVKALTIDVLTLCGSCYKT